MSIKDYSIFNECPNGHPLNVPNAFIYRAGGTRECRECARLITPKRRR